MASIFQLLRNYQWFSAIFVLISLAAISAAVPDEVVVVLGMRGSSRPVAACEFLAVSTFDKASTNRYTTYPADLEYGSRDVGVTYYNLSLTGSPGAYAPVATAETPYRVKLTDTGLFGEFGKFARDGISVEGVNTVGIEVIGLQKGNALTFLSDNEVVATVDIGQYIKQIEGNNDYKTRDPATGEKTYNVPLAFLFNHDVIDEVLFFQHDDGSHGSFTSRRQSFGYCEEPGGDVLLRWTKPQTDPHADSQEVRMTLEAPDQFISTVDLSHYAYISFDLAPVGHTRGTVELKYTRAENNIRATYKNLNVTEIKTKEGDRRCSVVKPGSKTIIQFSQEHNNQINMFSARLIDLNRGSAIVFRNKKKAIGKFGYKDILMLAGNSAAYVRPSLRLVTATVNFFCHECSFDEVILWQREKKKGAEGMLVSNYHYFGVSSVPVPQNAVGVKRLKEREDRRLKRIAKRLEAKQREDRRLKRVAKQLEAKQKPAI